MHNASEQPAKQPVMSISRILVIGFVVVAAIVIVWELRVRSQWDSTYQTISSKIDDEAHPLKKADIEKLIQGSPHRQGDKNEELFTWSGILQKYRMRLHYSGDVVTKIESQ